MENLEALSDQELRVRLQQYGFANLPVTDTTRKVLVKKLRLAIEGQTLKNRRETVAVAKFSSDEEPEKEETVKRVKTPNRRATVASEKIKPSSNGSQSNGNLTSSKSETISKSTSRRSSRATPSKEANKPSIAPLYPSLQEDSDDDVVEVIQETRRSRTPSMGKSETVRTSYKTSVEIPERHVEESVEVDDDLFEVPAPRNPSPMLTKTVHRKTFTTSTSGYSSKVPDSPSTFGRTSLSTSYNPRGKYKFADEEEDDVEKFELDETNAPYLSGFAKRLSTLRAEPLDSGMEKYKRFAETDKAADYQSSYKPVSYGYKTSAPAPRQAVRKSGFIKDVGRVFDSLDRQYNFRTILYVIFIVMIIVAILVIFM